MTDEVQEPGEDEAGANGAPEPQELPAEAEERASTEYIVLCQDEELASRWFVVGQPVAASSAKAAVSKVSSGSDFKTGSYKAVPSRSWRTFKVAETRPAPVRTVEEVD